MITVGIATMPGREENIQRVVADLSTQVDAIHVYANQLPGIPRWTAEYDNLFWHTGRNLTDAGKLYGLDCVTDGYYLVCDDDLLYPPDYAERLVDGIKRYGDERICGWSGGILKSPPINDYYRDGRVKRWHWKEEIAADQPCNMLLTCLAGWHVDVLRGWSHRACMVEKMTDIWLALEAQKRRIGMTVLARPAGWIQHQEIDHARTIWAELTSDGAEAQTGVINRWQYEFRLF